MNNKKKRQNRYVPSANKPYKVVQVPKEEIRAAYEKAKNNKGYGDNVFLSKVSIFHPGRHLV